MNLLVKNHMTKTRSANSSMKLVRLSLTLVCTCPACTSICPCTCPLCRLLASSRHLPIPAENPPVEKSLDAESPPPKVWYTQNKTCVDCYAPLCGFPGALRPLRPLQASNSATRSWKVLHKRPLKSSVTQASDLT